MHSATPHSSRIHMPVIAMDAWIHGSVYMCFPDGNVEHYCGDYLAASGWFTTALPRAGIASSGTADTFLKASDLIEVEVSHQVSVLAGQSCSRLLRDMTIMITKSPRIPY